MCGPQSRADRRARGKFVATVVRQLRHQPAAMFQFNLTKGMDHPHILRALKWFAALWVLLSRSDFGFMKTRTPFCARN